MNQDHMICPQRHHIIAVSTNTRARAAMQGCDYNIPVTCHMAKSASQPSRLGRRVFVCVSVSHSDICYANGFN